MRVRNLAVISLFFLLFNPSAYASVDYLELSPEQLLETQIYSAAKETESLSQTAAAAYVLTQEDLQRSGVTTIPEALRMVPGVNVARQGSNAWAISIRGFQEPLANKLLVMVDGRTVYNPMFSGTYWEIQNIPLENIERIEVIRGPGGALWGANAVNGVINIMTKKAEYTQGALVSIGTGTYENGFGTLRVGSRLGRKTFMNVYGHYANRDDFEEIGQNDAYDAWQSYRTGFRVDHDDEYDRDHLSLRGDFYHVDSRQYNTVYSLTAPYRTAEKEKIESQGGNLTGLWRHEFDTGASTKLQAYIDYTLRDQNLLSDDRWIFDIEGHYDFPLTDRHELSMGGGYRYMLDNLESSQIVSFHPASQSDEIFHAFIRDKIILQPERWGLTLGVKIEHNDYTGFELQPNARLAWTPNESQTLWAAVSRAVRTPSRFERDLNITNLVVPPGTIGLGAPIKVSRLPNDSFKSEKLIAYEAGYRQQITEDLSVDAAVFYNDYENLATSATTGVTFIPAGADPAHFDIPIQAVNDKTAEVYGFELASSWTITPDWKLSAGYSFLDMQLHAPLILGINQESDETQSPQQQLNLRSYWNINNNWSLDTMIYYVDQIPADRADDYIRLDLNLGWKINDNFNINLVGQNLLEESHHEFGSPRRINTTEVPRAVYGKLTWEF